MMKTLSAGPPVDAKFASITLHKSNFIRRLQFSPDVITALHNVIEPTWPMGIRRERTLDSCYEFDLRGNLWFGKGKDAIPARILIREILATLVRFL